MSQVKLRMVRATLAAESGVVVPGSCRGEAKARKQVIEHYNVGKNTVDRYDMLYCFYEHRFNFQYSSDFFFFPLSALFISLHVA
jgi:hypothetical protein